MAEGDQDRLFAEAIDRFGGALARLARGYEADTELRRDLEQELQVALWQSFATFDGRCSLSTWVWRVAHNRATSHMLANKRHAQRGWSSIEDVEIADADADATPFARADSEHAMALILGIIDRLDPPDRQILLLYLEGVAAAEIGAVTGVSPDGVATKIHRFKSMLTRRFAGSGDAR
ncbi:sigma-70 family RNA polymerase sigma factor [Sphingopyxis sp. JAI108]|uniref:RNA polymerase sigma factor n=1 Tax=Sphingopyxis sp. JAI108 TaxID=2723060 RepID=UPI001809C99F|nr:RNA polymerase sigma-70 factor (ECF subfamily) [Sphingopyxis sp. JAI108]